MQIELYDKVDGHGPDPLVLDVDTFLVRRNSLEHWANGNVLVKRSNGLWTVPYVGRIAGRTFGRYRRARIVMDAS